MQTELKTKTTYATTIATAAAVTISGVAMGVTFGLLATAPFLPPPITTQPPPTISLQSKFFSNDEVAQQIATGSSVYDITSYKLSCSGTPDSSYWNNYGFKVMNGLKQLGYFSPCLLAEPDVGHSVLKMFQRKNNLPESPLVDRNVLLALDAQLAQTEMRDGVGKNFVCYNYLADAPARDASKDHMAFLYLTAMQAFPEELRMKNSECKNYQTFGVNAIATCTLCPPPTYTCTSYYTLCPKYWSQITVQGCGCALREDAYGPTRPQDDHTLVATTVHEFSHFIDVSKKIDTQSFNNISYDITDQVTDGGWIFYKPRIDMLDRTQLKNNFFSYARGWQSIKYPGYYTAYEDFAVSVSMYILHGIEFRDYLKDKPVLGQKYQWIKKNAFQGKEFNTGDPNYKSYAPDLLTIPRGNLDMTIVEATGIVWLRPHYIWDYQIIPVAAAPAPTPISPLPNF